ncbi:oxidoreductase [Rhodophyticola sp. SM2404]
MASGARSFSDQDLLDLPQVSFETSTLWTEGVLEFSGPSLKSVLASSGAGQGNIVMTAVNDYSVEMPQDIVSDELPIIANRMNGEPFSVRDKGPLWVVFPYDSDTELQQELIYSYSIWQLNRIEVLG